MPTKNIKRTIPLAAMEKILKDCGAERVADSAKMALKEQLEDVAAQLSASAARYASHAGRKTVKASDIKLAAK